MNRDDEDREPDARSAVNMVLVVATSLLLTTELLFFVALFILVLRGSGVR